MNIIGMGYQIPHIGNMRVIAFKYAAILTRYLTHLFSHWEYVYLT